MNPKISDWHGMRVWIIGASSGIGAQTAVELQSRGARLALSARSVDGLKSIASGHPDTVIVPLDVTDHDSVNIAKDEILSRWGGFDLALIVAGTYRPMRADTFDLATAKQLIDVNLNGTLNCLDAILPTLLAQGRGGIGVVASVAGLGGLPQALVYGPSKAALINLCESLYLDLHPAGIGVYLINPGFVETRLTAANEFRMPALIDPATAARALLQGLEQGAFHIHFPRRFTNWLRLLRLLPYPWYFRVIHKVTGL
jgi:short-subunit dehydrogenase